MSRYIDIEKLDCIMFEGKSIEFVEGAEAVLDMIDNLPKEDVAPVKHGHWHRVHVIEMYGGDPNDWNSYAECAVVCSECGSDFELEAHEYSYCPHCGAKMVDAE